MKLKPLALRSWRAGVLVALAWLIHHEHAWLEAQRSPSVTLELAQRLFPAARRISPRDIERGGHFVYDAADQPLGYVLTTAPETNDLIGYSGPSNVLLGLDANGAVAGAQILTSGDTQDHVDLVRKDQSWLSRFLGWKPLSDPPPQVAAVSGATLTSAAIAESIERRLAGHAPSLRFSEPVTLAEVRELFPAAANLQVDESASASSATRLRVLDADDKLLGFAVRTSPWSDNVSGYRGPTESLVGLRPDGQTVAGLRIRKSFDTPDYVDSVKDDEYWMKEVFVGKTTAWLANMDYERDKIEGVSGATQTSWAMAEGLKRRFAAEQPRAAAPWQWQARDAALAVIVAASLAMAFTNLRGNRWARRLWQAVLIGYVGLASGDLLSLGLMTGWAQNGVAWRSAAGLALLLAAALLVPWVSRRQLYCHHLCPHGAAQQWLGTLVRRKTHVPIKLARLLEAVPYLLIGVALLAVLRGWPMDLADLEPFDAWAWRAAGAASITIAVVGLIASLRIRLAYCRFGCPTGALLELVRSHGSADRFGRRDWFALGLLLLALVARPSLSAAIAKPAFAASLNATGKQSPAVDQTEFRGRAMGTTWCVKLDRPAPAALQQELADCLERVENLASNWRPDSDVCRFNRQQTTDDVPVPRDLAWLVEQSQAVSRASGGAFDITVAPLVSLWGFGPRSAADQAKPLHSPAPRAPDTAALAKARRAVGWHKVRASTDAATLCKLEPAVTLDLASIAEGWAVDELSALLQRHGQERFLVEAGGELRARGRWTVGIERPARIMTLCDQSLSTSGTYRQHWNDAGHQRSHVIDPRTGHPVTHDTVSVSVLHPNCTLADAWSTALLVLGADEGLIVADREKLAAAFVVERARPSGEGFTVRFSPAWPQP